jgi:hypothetical protein
MKNLLFVLVFVGSIIFTSCASEQCVCTISGTTTTFTEEDAKDAGVDMVTYCDGLDAIYASNPNDGCEIN